MMLPLPCFTVRIVPGFFQMWRLTFRPKSSILVSSDQRILFLMVWQSLGAFWQSTSMLSSAFYWGLASVCQLYHKCLIGGVGCHSGRFSHLHRGTLELCQSDHQVLVHLPDQGLSPPIAQLGWTASSRKGLGGDGDHCVFGDLQFCRNVLVPFPRSVPRHNPVLELDGQFLRPHGLVFALTCTVNCWILYRQVCAFMSNQFNLPKVDCCRNISRVIHGNRMNLSSKSSLIAKGLNTYVKKVFVLFFNTFANISKNLFSLCHYGYSVQIAEYFFTILE
jgi:hypothetical protein